MEFGRQKIYESLKGSGASEMFAMYVLKYPGSPIAFDFVNRAIIMTREREKKFYDALWKGDIVDCIFSTSERERGQLERILFSADTLALYRLLPNLEES